MEATPSKTVTAGILQEAPIMIATITTTDAWTLGSIAGGTTAAGMTSATHLASSHGTTMSSASRRAQSTDQKRTKDWSVTILTQRMRTTGSVTGMISIVLKQQVTVAGTRSTGLIRVKKWRKLLGRIT